MASAELRSIIAALRTSARAPEERLALVRAYLAAGDPAMAAQEAEGLVSLGAEACPSIRAEALYVLGQARGLTGDSEGAMAAWKELLALDPRHRKGIMGLAALQSAEGQADSATETYARGLAQYPADSFLTYRLMALNPHHPYLLVARGDAAALTGDPELAMEYYQQAARLRPSDGEVLWRLAWACRRAGRPEWAVEAWKQAESADPGLLQKLYDRGAVLLQPQTGRE